MHADAKPYFSLHFPDYCSSCFLTCLACPPLPLPLRNDNSNQKKVVYSCIATCVVNAIWGKKTYVLPLSQVVAEDIRYSVNLMATFQELVISLWASVGWNLNGWNVRVICNMFQLSGEQHT